MTAPSGLDAAEPASSPPASTAHTVHHLAAAAAREHLSHLPRFMSVLLQATTISEIASAATAELREVFAADVVELALGAEATPRVKYSLPLATVLQSGFPLLLLPEEDDGPPSARGPRPQRVVCCLPLILGKGLTGAIGISYATSPEATSRDFDLFHAYAQQIALALSRARADERAEAERRRADEAHASAAAASRAKGDLLALLGHELRNPLSPIVTAVELMRLRAGGVLVKERSIIERHVSHMVRLVDDLMDVSRITHGKVELDRAPVEIAEVINQGIERASSILVQRSQRLVTTVPARGLVVHADAGRIAQAIGNLITNAAKYGAPNGRIDVVARRNGERVEVSVRDDGAGIEPNLLPNVFEPFVQGQQTVERAAGGLGLGLAIARNLIELHGGTLRAASDGPGKGGLFTLELDLVGSSIESARASTPDSSSDPETSNVLRRRRILVVDDNQDAANLLAELLETGGFQVRVAHDGPSALALSAVFHPELALLDVGLPGMDGHELAGRLRSLPDGEQTKLVALTGYGAPPDRRRSSETGFDTHLVKPVNHAHLRALILELLPESGCKPEGAALLSAGE